VGLLTEDVNHDHDCVKPVCLQKLHNEVYRDVSQCSSGISVG
jgi:hypothetical protein